jgi:hypothetical protein
LEERTVPDATFGFTVPAGSATADRARAVVTDAWSPDPTGSFKANADLDPCSGSSPLVRGGATVAVLFIR